MGPWAPQAGIRKKTTIEIHSNTKTSNHIVPQKLFHLSNINIFNLVGKDPDVSIVK